jgi:hypothetical protein
MPVCMASYMMAGYGHVNHVLIMPLGLMYVFKLLYISRCFKVMACLGFQLVDNCIKG